MAGRPMKRQMLSALVAKSAAAGKTPAEYVQDFIGSGRSVSELAEVVGCSRSHLSRHINNDPTISKALAQGKLDGAEAMADAALAITDDLARRLDEGEEIPQERIGVLKEQNRMRQWLASSYNPERFAKQDKNIQINIGDLHLDALRKNRTTIDITPARDDDDGRDD